MNRAFEKTQALALTLICGLIPIRAAADVWNETDHGDAGELVSTAQLVIGSGFLTEINGELTDGSDRDIFQVYITDPNNFSFHVTATGVDNNDADTILALFDTTGFGIVYNDDISDTDFTSLLDNTSGLVTQPGYYYIAIMGGEEQFTGASGPIWLEQAPWTDMKAPDGPGATEILGGYSAAGGTNVGTYTITISGGVTGVPEPSAYPIALVAIGIMLIVVRYRSPKVR